jgi:hypothetical protein
LIVLALLSTAPGAGADDAAGAARAVFEANKEAVVTLKMVVNLQVSMGGDTQEQERQLEVTGTVIDPDGLTVVALSEVDPSGMFGAGSPYDINATIKNIEILGSDGSETEAEIVLRDRDFDLAYIRPVEEAQEPMAAVDTSDPGNAAVLDQVVVISRLGKVASREHGVSLARIEAIVEKPRKFYAGPGGPMGAPVFTMDGRMLGVVVLRSSPLGGGSMGMGGDMMPIVRPVSDILESRQAVPLRGQEPAQEEPETAPAAPEGS